MSVRVSDVKVFVRIRPTANFAKDLIQFLPDGQTVSICLKNDSRRGVVNNQRCSWSFRLDRVLHDVSQEEVYDSVACRVVLAALDGYNGTVMCFGQTGAGKTYTMTGATEKYKQRGIIPRALQEVFREVEQRPHHTITVQLSFLEIYNETLLDLLSSVQNIPAEDNGLPGGMSIVEEAGGGVVVRGLSLHRVHSEEEALSLLFEGEMNRIIGAHSLNRNSSRSHCILSIHIESRSRTLSEAKYVTSKLSLVDLAGSERLGKTGSEGQLLKEATYINKSLSFLEQAILALADRSREHVPFRQSRLTHALKDCLGGNCNTVLVANVYGEAAQIEETLSTLRFASRMKRVQTEPAINEHADPVVLVRKLQREVQMLKQELFVHDSLANRTGVSYEALTDKQVVEIQRQVRQYLDGASDDIEIVNVRQIQEVFAQFRLAMQRQEQMLKARLPERNSLEENPQVPAAAAGVRAEAQGGKGSAGEVETGGPGLAERQRAKQSKGKDVSSPPLKAEAFEDFKAERGNEINCILKENKAVLLDQRRRLRELTDGVNATKQKIDQASASLQLQRHQNQSDGEFLTAEGEPVMEEEELKLVLKLQQLKAQYRRQHEELRGTRAEVNYCEHLVHQCRTRLLMEFESWYNESFLLPEDIQVVLRTGGPIQPGMIPVEKALALVSCSAIVLCKKASIYSLIGIHYDLDSNMTVTIKESDKQEPFKKLRHELQAVEPGSTPYYNAHSRTMQKRTNSRAMAQTPKQTRNLGARGGRSSQSMT